MITLETERLVLRMFTLKDAAAYHSIYAEPEVVRYVGDGRPLTQLEAWRHMAIILGHWQLRGYGTWAVEEKTSARLIGRVGFIHPEGWPGLELGWTLGSQFWGQGYATEAARAALRHGFNHFGFTRVVSFIREDNLRSIRVAGRLGGIRDGTTELSGRPVLVYAYSPAPPAATSA